jgi:serine/threonine-protein kinase
MRFVSVFWAPPSLADADGYDGCQSFRDDHPAGVATWRHSLGDDGAPSPLGAGRYEVLEEIGDGAMGRVWRGHDPLIGRAVAVKTVKAEYLTRETRDEYLQRFRREARAAGQLSHPNIVSLYDVGDDYFVMELLEGATLADLIRERGRVPLAEALSLLEPIADAIDYAHRAGVVHRDIKPANIMVQPDGQPKLMDFGVARLETSIATAPGHFFGSPSYMAPEQITSSQATARSDLFSFAVVVYEALTGQRPFQGESITAIIYQVVNADAPAPTSLGLDLPGRHDAVFRRALAKKADERFSSALAFMGALKGGAFDAPPDHPRPDVDLVTALGLDTPGAEELHLPRGGDETLDIASVPPPRARRRSSLWAAVGATGTLALAGLLAVVRVPPPVAADLRAGLAIESEPSGAAVWLDGAPAGQAPVVLSPLALGPHRVRVVREGYAPAEVQLHATEGMGLVPLRFALSGVTAPVAVRTQDGVTVIIDGHEVGRTPLAAVHVSPGVHELRLERGGFATQRHALLARPGEPLTIEARLLPAPAEVAEASPPAATAVAEAVPDPVPVPTAGPIEPPRPLKTEPARYPEAARRLQLEGSVLLDITVEEDGRVGYVHVLESAGVILDQAVAAAARGWLFEPARQDGRPVRAQWHFRQTFRPR